MEETLSPALANDAAGVADLVEAAYAPYIARIGTKPGPMLDDCSDIIARHIVHVARAEGSIMGVVVLIEGEDAILLDNIAVAPEAQGRGIGRRLMEFAEAEAVPARLCPPRPLYPRDDDREYRDLPPARLCRDRPTQRARFSPGLFGEGADGDVIARLKPSSARSCRHGRRRWPCALRRLGPAGRSRGRWV